MRKLFAFLLILTWMCMRMHIQAQTYTMLSSGDSIITTCSGVIYDPGGMGDYPSNCDSYLTIYPGSGGSKVRLTGTYNTEGTTYAWDYFNVYDGTSNTGTQLGSFHGLGTCDVISLTGPLTIYFHSDGSVQHAGFELNVSCCTDVCACSSPTGVHIRTGNQFIKVLWNPSMLTNGYFLEYGPHGFTPGAGSRIYTSATSYTLNNLTNDTEYDIYIWFDCGNDHRITTELPVMVSATPGSNCTMTSGTREFEICNGFVYDNGGPTGNYSNYSNDTLIIYPATNGCKVSIVGTYYTESASFDYIKIYDGAGVAGTLLGKFAETGTITEPIYSTSPDGMLTVVFHSDGSVQKSGYELQVACICYVDHVQDTVCYKERYQNHGFDTSLAYSGDYTLIRVANSTLIDVDLHVRPSPYVSIAGRHYFCADGDITLTANTAVSYAWSTGEHSQSIHVHDIGSYQVTITDSHGCVASASHRIAPIDEFIDMIDFPTMCAGKDYLITGSYESGSEILMHRVQSTLSSADTAFLPDGIACDPYGCSYRSTLTFTDYSSNAYVRDANDIYYVKINMEHSFIGDIYINIICPNGQKADIMRKGASVENTYCVSFIPESAKGWSAGTNSTYADFGQANPNRDTQSPCDQGASLNAPGIGWNYCWSNNTTQGYVYAADGGFVYRDANIHNSTVDSSDVEAGLQFYHPDEPFASLIGCPLNGDWYIEVVDGFSVDNGYIFGWELALTEELLPNNTFNVSEITPVGPWIAGMTSDTSFTISPPGTLQEDTTVQYLLHFYDSDNCSYDTLVRVSVNTLHYGDTVASACGSFTWHGVTYTQSGSYNDTLQTSAGCDSIVTLHLTIWDLEASVTNDGPYCVGDTIHLICENPQTGASYSWTGPNGWTSSDVNPVIYSASLEMNGTYTLVKALNGDCSAQASTTIQMGQMNIADDVSPSDTICVGEEVTLTVACFGEETPIFSEGFSTIIVGNDDSNTGSGNKYQCILPNFPNCDNEHVFLAGGHLRFGDVSSGGGGYITSRSMDLSQPFTVKMWMRGWKSSRETPWFYLKVDNDTVLQQYIPTSEFSDPYTEYDYISLTGATANSTITIGNADLYQRFFLDSVVVVQNGECQYSWSTGATTNSITVSPTQSLDYYVTVTSATGCAEVDTFSIVVNTQSVVTFVPCGGTCAIPLMIMDCHDSIVLPSAVPCASNYEFAGWSTTPVNSAVTTEPTPLYLAGEHFSASEDMTLYAVYKICEMVEEVRYAKVTAAPINWSGEYLIAYHDGGLIFDGSLTTLDAVNNNQSVTFNGNYINNAAALASYTFTINRANANTYTIRSASGYYIGQPSDANGLASNTTTQYNNTISYNGGNIDIVSSGGAYLCFNNAANQNRFRYYRSSTYTNQKAIQLYRKEQVEGDCEWLSYPSCPVSIAVDTNSNPNGACDPQTIVSPTFTVTDACFENPTATVTSGGVVAQGCTRSQTWTATYENACGESATPVSVTYTWKVSSDTVTTSSIICENESVALFDTVLATSGVYTRVGTTSCGCDSVVILDLTVNLKTYGDTTAVECGRFDWYDHANITESGDYTHVFVGGNANGCDSVVMLHLLIQKPDTIRYDRTVCKGTRFQEYGFDTLMTTSGTYLLTRTLYAQQTPCDTLIELTLHVTEPVVVSTVAQSVCPSSNSVVVVAQFQNLSGDNNAVIWTSNNVVETHDNLVTPLHPKDSFTLQIPLNLCDDSLFYTVEYSDGICMVTETNFIHVVDTVPPAVNGVLPSLNLAGCSEDDVPSAFTNAGEINALDNISIADNCTSMENITIQHSDSVVSSSCDISMVRIYTLTDICCNATRLMQDITLVRTSDFTISQVDTADTVVCFSMALAENFTLPEVQDACGLVLQPSSDSPTVSGLDGSCEGSVRYTYTYRNCSGGDTVWTFNYHIALPDSFTSFPANGVGEVQCLADVLPPTPPVVEDACGNTLNVTSLGSTENVNPDGSGTVDFLFRYSDCAGNDSVWTYTYTLTPNQFTPKPDLYDTVYCVSEALDDTVPVVTNCGIPVALTHGVDTNRVEDGCGDMAYVYNYTVNDVHYTWTHYYHVAPVPFVLPANQECFIQCLDSAVQVDPPVVVNACSDTIHPIALPVSIHSDGCTGYVIYAWDYVDCSGDTARWTYTYVVADTTPPTFIVPADLVICRDTNGAYDADPAVTGIAIRISDNCSSLQEIRNSCQETLVAGANGVDTLLRQWIVKDNCDNENVQTQRITIMPVRYTTVVDSICEGEVYDTLNFNFVANVDTVVYLQLSSHETRCDSLITLNLTVFHPVNESDSVTTTDEYTWNGITYAQSGMYTHHHPDIHGCDQVDTLYLTIHYPSSSDIYDTACDIYTWNGVDYTESGVYAQHFTNEFNVDSTVVLHLTINHSKHTTIYDTVCYSYEWNGVVYTETGVYEQHFQTSDGCDSIVTLELRVNYNKETNIQEIACEEYTWYDVTYTESGIYAKTLESSDLCDSTVILYLTINHDVSLEWWDTVCNVKQWNDEFYTESGEYVQHFETALGCDSAVTLHLVVNHSDTTVFDATGCDTYTWENIEYAQSSEYTRTFTNQFGCDSMVTMRLTIHSATYSTLYDTITQNSLPYDTLGMHFTEAGTKKDTILNQYGCDSIITMHLFVAQNVVVEVDSTICENDLPFTWNHVVFNQAGTMNDTLTAANGSDSIVVMTLNVVFNTYSVENEFVIENNLPHVFNGHTFTGPITNEQIVIPNANGCDSIITYSLQVWYNVKDTVERTICENDLPYSWNNVPFSAPGMQNAVFTLPNGADSVLTMVLFVHNNTQSTIYDTIVENGLPYDTLDMHFADAGTLSDTIANTNGCDSIVTMHLYVWYNVANTVDSTVCENNLPIVWNDVVFEAAGENTIVLVGNHGVDSALTMRLAVIPKDVSVFHDEVCEGRDYFGHGFVVPGNQTVHIPDHHLSIENTFENELGCDSIVQLELDIVDTTVYIRPLFDFCDNMSTTLSVYTQMTDYVWSTGETSQNIDVTAPGLYSVTAVQGNCQSEAVIMIEDCPTEIYLPNAITPGKLDGHNDCFSLPERCQNMIDEFEITIFNRWGQPVFHSKDKAFKWYGEYKDNVYRQNVYEYLIDYTENNRFHRKVKLRGSVVVL